MGGRSYLVDGIEDNVPTERRLVIFVTNQNLPTVRSRRVVMPLAQTDRVTGLDVIVLESLSHSFPDRLIRG